MTYGYTMKKNYYIVCGLLTCIIPLFSQSELNDQLSELYIPESEFVLTVDDGIRGICRMLTHEWKSHHLCFSNDDLTEILDPATQEVAIEKALRALHYCIHTELNSHSKKEKDLRETLAEIYNEITDAYNEILAESGSRRIKIKFYNKVTTGELVVNRTAHIQDLTVQKNLIIKAASGALISQNGLVTTGPIPASAIPDGSITNAKISSSPPAVNGTNIVPMTITPDLMAFNTVQTFANEPNPLRIYRGSITGATGAITSGLGFTVTRTGAGAYTVDISGPAYTSNATYQIFIQLTSETNPVTLVPVSGSQFTVSTVADHDFSFFTIGN